MVVWKKVTLKNALTVWNKEDFFFNPSLKYVCILLSKSQNNMPADSAHNDNSLDNV